MPASSVPTWDNQTGYPVYQDVFYYNPDVRKFIVGTVTGPIPPEEEVITAKELIGLTLFLDGVE